MEQTLIDEIKELYSQINEKTKFMEMVASDLIKKPNTLKNHWFSSFFSIPDEYQERVMELLQNTIKEQVLTIEVQE